MSNETKRLGVSDPKTDKKFKEEKTLWSDMLDLKNSVIGQIGINLATCEQLSKDNEEYFNNDKDAGLMLMGITKSYCDVANDIKELNTKLDKHLYKDFTKKVLLDPTNKYDVKKLVVKNKDELKYMAMYVGYTEAGETVGRLGIDLMLNLSTKLNCSSLATEAAEIVNNFDKEAGKLEEEVVDSITPTVVVENKSEEK